MEPRTNVQVSLSDLQQLEQMTIRLKDIVAQNREVMSMIKPSENLDTDQVKKLEDSLNALDEQIVYQRNFLNSFISKIDDEFTKTSNTINEIKTRLDSSENCISNLVSRITEHNRRTDQDLKDLKRTQIHPQSIEDRLGQIETYLQKVNNAIQVNRREVDKIRERLDRSGFRW